MNMKKSLLFIFVLVTIFSWQTAKAENLFTKNLYFGIQKDSEVTKLQEFLTSEGVYSGPITGNFFSLTLKAVKDYQTREGISPAAGYFGPLTRNKANEILLAQLGVSNAQAIKETGSEPIIPIIKSTSDSLQEQIDALLNQINLLNQQLTTQKQTEQNIKDLQTQVVEQTLIIQQQQTILGAIQQNTTPTPTPTPPPPPPPAPKELVILRGGWTDLTTFSGGQIIHSSSTRAVSSITGEVWYTENVSLAVKQGDRYLGTPETLAVEITTLDSSQNKTGNEFVLKLEKCIQENLPSRGLTSICPKVDGRIFSPILTAQFNYKATEIGTHKLTFYSPSLNSTASVDIIVQ